MSAWSNSMLLIDGDVGQVLQELGRLVEEGAVVLVAFDDEVAAAADAVARSAVTEVERDAADEHRRIDAAVRQQPAGQRRRRGLAVRAGEDDRARAPQEVIADRFRQRAVADLPLEHRLELRVAARDGIADDHQVDVVGDVLGGVAGGDGNALTGEKVAHRRIDVLVGAAHVVPAPLQQRRQRRHRRAADADEMNPLFTSTGASSTMSPPRRRLARER